jgi:tetratricopeptide (TPR) repeat protein
VSGRASFTVAGEEVDAPSGTIVFVRDPAVTRSAVAAEPGTTVLAVGGRPGEAFRPRAWETNADAFALLDGGKPAEAKQVLLEALDRYEDRGVLLYNLACAEAQLGETDAALEHLRGALAERPDWAESARTDSDLAPIRDDPRFAEIVG